jgi:hypothetical protein
MMTVKGDATMPRSSRAATFLARLRGRMPPEAVDPDQAIGPAIALGMTAERYLKRHYATMPGFSSQYSAEVAVQLLAYQAARGITGHIGEIGALLGRSFIPLALAAAAPDICLAIDEFEWPANVYERFLTNCRSFGVDMSRLMTIKADSTTLGAPEIVDRLGGGKIRYLHIDGGHTPDVLRHDLALGHALIEPGGILCLDDMLHAQYPELGTVVQCYLAAHADLVVFCIVDRADLIAASKFLICRRDYAGAYQACLRDAFALDVFPDPAEFSSGEALILSKDTALAPGYRDMIERPPAAGLAPSLRAEPPP